MSETTMETTTVLGADVRAGDVLLRDGKYFLLHQIEQPTEPAVVVQAWATAVVGEDSFDYFSLAFGVGARFQQVYESDGVRVLRDRWLQS